jgi:hypothetical protein
MIHGFKGKYQVTFDETCLSEMIPEIGTGRDTVALAKKND